jgi:hypothetical protein
MEEEAAHHMEDRKHRVWKGLGVSHNFQRQTPSDLPPVARPHLPKFPPLSTAAMPAGDISLGGTFYSNMCVSVCENIPSPPPHPQLHSTSQN